jgi:nucleoside-diphosphate-sugar epimerase
MILVTGADGYLGWPVLLRLSRSLKNERIVGVDNGARREWVKEIGSVSAIPIADMKTREEAAHELGFANLTLIKADLTDRKVIYQLLNIYKPRAVVHLAAQPSAPYAHINGERADFTQENNTRMCRNLLWGLHELGLDNCHFIETTTTGVYGQPEMDIPEGFVEVDGWHNKKERIPYPGMATSWYHMSKAHDVNNLYLAHYMWKMPITDIRTSIIFGANTQETAIDQRLATRFDFDYYFGVVPNRFIAQALAGYPISIYGKGEQKKPMIALEDAVTSVVNAVFKTPEKSFVVYNQYSLLVSPKDLAEAIAKTGQEQGIAVKVEHIPNPRVEKEAHDMIMHNGKFRQILSTDVSVNLEHGIRDMFNALKPYQDTFRRFKDRFV